MAPRAPMASTLGRYRLAYEIASGGMATVYLAVAPGARGFGKVVALKRIHPHLAGEREFVDMFMDEARIASLFAHPNVCGVNDFGEDDGTLFLTMEFLAGEPLARIQRAIAREPALRASPRLPLFAARVFADACEGLHAAHETLGPDGRPLAVVHRDISPHNLFVTYDGCAKVVDFGIVRAETRLCHTQAGFVKGKFAYMAPEQMRGAAVDRRADVWSLGVVLWETLTLRRLFKRDTDAETVLAVGRDRVPRVSEVRPGIDPELDRIVARALAREPERRYPTAREMGKDLARYVARASEPFDLSDAARVMQALFASRREATLRRVHDALALASHGAPVSAEPPGSGERSITASVVRRRTVHPPPLDTPVPPAFRRARRGRSGSPWLTEARARAIAMVALLLLLAVVVFAALGRSASSPSEADPDLPDTPPTQGSTSSP